MQRICPLNEPNYSFSVKNAQEQIKKLPVECFLLIFKHLSSINLGGLLASALVDKQWLRNIKSEYKNLNSTIKEINKYILGPQNWAKFMDIKFCSDEEIQKAFSLLPSNIFEILNSPCTVFPNMNELVKNTHVLVYVSRQINGVKITLTKLGETIAIKLPLQRRKLINTFSGYSFGKEKKLKGYKFIRADIISILDRSLDQPRWVLMTKYLLEGSRAKSYGAQKKMVQQLSENTGISYVIPKTLDAVAVLGGHFMRSNNYLLGKATYTRCQHNVDRHQVVVGEFNEEGLTVNSLPDSNDIGIAVCRIFPEKGLC